MTENKPQRLVLEIPPSRQITTRDFRLFYEAMAKQEVEDGSEVSVVIEPSGSLKFMVPIPVKNKPRQSKYKQQVEAQIASRREAIDRGEEVPGYVPPVKPRKVVKIPKQKRRTVTIKKSPAKARAERKRK